MDFVRYAKDAKTNSVIGFDAEGKAYIVQLFGVPLEVNDSSDAMEDITELKEAIQNVYTKDEIKNIVPADVSRTQTDATFVARNGNTLVNLFYLRGANDNMCGLMSASDYKSLHELITHVYDIRENVRDVNTTISELLNRVSALENNNNSVQ